MLPRRLFCTVAILVLALPTLQAQPSKTCRNPAQQKNQSSTSNSSNGIEIQSGALHERVTALRSNVLRVTLWRGLTPPEDSSWAVLDSARSSTVAVRLKQTPQSLSLDTGTISVEVDRRTLQLTVRDSAGKIVQQDARPVRFDGDAFRLYKTMPPDEHYFGLGDKTGSFDRRDQAFALWNTDAYRFQESTDPLYKSIPYFMAYRAGVATGILLDNTWRSSFDFGKESPGVYSFGAVHGPVNYYILYGPAPKDVVKAYAWLTGTPPLPPLWALGYQQSRYSYMSQNRVLEVADRLRADRIPADAVYLDIDFQQQNRPFTVNRSAFPDLPGMVAELHRKHFHVVTITDLHIANLPGEHYQPFDSGIAGDHFVKNPNGSIYVGKVWPGPSVFPDFTRQQTRQWWGTLYAGLKQDGVDGFWNDMNEPSVFDSPTHTIPENVVHRIEEPGFSPRTATHAEVHNVYGMENARATYEGLLTLDPETRPFVLTRAAYAGGQRYGATWTGDNSSTWNHLRLTTPMLKNLGLSGFALSGADVGGYAGTPNPELLTKWMEIAAFQPLDRDHTEKGTADQEPWVSGPEQEATRRRFIEERYRLMPYLYTLAEEASRTGIPIERPLFLEFPDAAPDKHPIDIDGPASNEFMLGAALLIAPSPFPDEIGPYSIELPSRGWYDYWTGEPIPAPAGASSTHPDPTATAASTPGMVINATPELSTLPVFVRAGSILPEEPLVESTGVTPVGPLTLRVYVGNPCFGDLYLDDGKTFAYRHGAYLRMHFSCELSGDTLKVTIGPHTGSFPAWWHAIRVQIYGWRPHHNQVVVNSKEMGAPVVEPASVDFMVGDDGHGSTILLQ